MKIAGMIAPLFAATMAITVPQAATAQEEFPLVSGDYVEVAAISIKDGHALDYAKHIAGMWRKGQDFAKEKGWITDYEILWNSFARAGEPDIYLITRWSAFPTPAEEDARQAAYAQHMAMTMTQMQEASGDRASYRTLSGSMLLREQKFRN